MASKNDKKGKYSSVQKAALIILLIAALGVFVFSGYMLIERQSEYNASRNEYDNLRDQFKQTEQAADAASSPIDFDGLKQENPETVGWIEIPSADISYPVVQAENNEKYLTTGFDGNESKSGAIFLDYKSQPDMMGYHTIIYGHHMRDGSMFANLVDFKDADYFEKNSQITLYTPERTLNLTVIAAYAQSASDTAVRQFEFADDADFHAFADGRVKLSQNKREGADEALKSVDRLYTFITCSYEGDDMRTIVHAIEIAE